MSTTVSPQGVGDTVSNSINVARDLVDSTLEEATNLRQLLGCILQPQEEQEKAVEGHQPFPVDKINDIEQINEILREIRYILRDVQERLAL